METIISTSIIKLNPNDDMYSCRVYLNSRLVLEVQTIKEKVSYAFCDMLEWLRGIGITSDVSTAIVSKLARDDKSYSKNKSEFKFIWHQTPEEVV